MKRDQAATVQALIVVVLVALVEGLSAGRSLNGINVTTLGLSAIVGWLLWSGVVYLVGRILFGSKGSYGRVLRTPGFADTPGLLNVFTFIPFLGPLIRIVVGLWRLILGWVAIRAALEFGFGRLC